MINVNLIAERERQRRLGEAAGRVAFFVAVFVFVVTVIAVTMQQTRLRALANNLEMAKAEITQLQARKTSIDVLQRQVDSKRPLVELLRGARDSEAKWCMALTHIAEATPTRASIISVRSSDSLQPKVKEPGASGGTPVKYEGFTITGEAMSAELVGQFITNLQNTESFGDVYVESVRRRKAANEVEVFEFDAQALLAKEKPAP